MIKKKNLLVIATAGVVALGYAAVSTNAFADTSVATPIPTVSTATTSAITPPAVPSIPTDLSVAVGIQAPSGLANSSLSTMPSTGDDDGDDQSSGLSAGVSLSGDDDGDDDNSSSFGVSISQSDDNDGDSQQNNDGQDDSGSDD